MTRARLLVPAIIVAALSTGCDERVLVRWATRVYEDGSARRRLDVTGSDPNGAVPEKPEWFIESPKIDLADAGAWNHIERTPARILAEGFFPPGALVPGTIAHSTDTGLHPDHVRTSIRVQDFVVLKSFTYRESYGDPFGAEERTSALKALFEMARRYLHEGIRAEFGESVAVKPADEFLESDLRPLVSDLLAAGVLSDPLATRDLKPAGMAPRAGAPAWVDVLRRYQVTMPPVPPDADPIDAVAPAVLDWSRARLAERLSRGPGKTRAEDLPFLIKDSPDAARLAERLFGSEEEVESVLQARLEALQGYYSSSGIPDLTFESHVDLPGRITLTNGTPDAEGSIWFFRGEDLRGPGQVMNVESVLLDDEKLRSLGARREFDLPALLRLTDILMHRDANGRIRALLQHGVERGGLAALRTEPIKKEEEADDLARLRRQLADLLDPAVPQP